ncbi:hypothetical protein UFVDC4_00194 [Staphylococcus phage vB_SauM-UFV_DC4]|nr:hypothetical protein UFVDC4_00194 [Staphylococcus phage vB_SauM-UFV_DC4]BDE75773.1 hypothetical protein [Staphylococcus phage S6]
MQNKIKIKPWIVFWTVFIIGFIVGEILGYVEGKSLFVGIVSAFICLGINYMVGEIRRDIIRNRK